MKRIRDLGIRVELVPADKTCNDISIGLYMREQVGGSEFIVHSYASYDWAQERVSHVSSELERLTGMERVGNEGYLRFPCGSGHVNALRRVFARICRVPTAEAGQEFPMSVFDKKADCDIAVEAVGQGTYRFYSVEDKPTAARRTTAVMNGMCKLTKMVADESGDPVAQFDCKTDHNAMVAMLLTDAINVRVATREQDELGAGGVLTAPGSAD